MLDSVESTASEVRLNSVAVAILSVLILKPATKLNCLKAVPELLNPIRDKYERPHVEKDEVSDAVAFLEQNKVITLDRTQSIAYSLTSLGQKVARMLLPVHSNLPIPPVVGNAR